MRHFAAAILIFGSFFAASTGAQTFDWTVDEIDVYDMRVMRIGPQRLTVQIDGVGRRSFRVPSDFRFYIDGEPTRLDQLAPRQPLRAYVTRSESGEMQLVDAGPTLATPPATPTSTPVVAVSAPLPDDMAALPKTGLFLPLPLGVAFGAGALALGLRLRRNAS